MLVLTLLTLLLVIATAVMAHWFVHERAGRILLAVVIVVIPVSIFAAGAVQDLEDSTSTQFCLSCHEMEPYGRSLHLDDMELLPAVHFQNGLVPQDHACYSCHKDYTMFGDVKSKLTGMRHVWAHYVAGVPEDIELYKPFPNSNCLHCHEHSRSFLESSHHDNDKVELTNLISGKRSCLSSRCHDLGHATDELEGADFWPEDDS